MITYEFQVPPTYMPPDYRDGMRGLSGLNPRTETSGGGGIFGRHDPAALTYASRAPMVPYDTSGPRLAGGIFRGSLGSLGDAASDLKDQAIAEFQAAYQRVRQEVQTAAIQVIGQSIAAGRPGISATFANNVAHLDSIAEQVRRGDVGKAAAYATVARTLIGQAKELNNARWWQNLPSVEEWVTIIQNIPQKFADAIVAAAGTAGGAAGALLRNAGVDPEKLIDTTGSIAKWLGVGAVGLAVIYLVSR